MRSEFIKVVDLTYRDMANLRPGEQVLIVADSRTPTHVSEAFMGGAMAAGATAIVMLVETPPPPSVQPSTKWPPTLAAAAVKADLIIDMSVGYADFIVEAVQRGARIIIPGDGTGGWHIEESLIRTMLAVDVHELRREADAIADLFTRAKVMRVTSPEGTDLTINIAGVKGDPSDGFLWDPDKGRLKSRWACLPPAQPGLVLPPGSGDGVIAADGFVLYEPAYNHETPKDAPVFIHVKKGRIVHVEGDPLVAGRLRHWLRTFGDETVSCGPVHANLGTNPRAMLTQHQEFERIRGSIDFGWGDTSGLARLLGYKMDTIKSPAHWDTLVLRPNLHLDDVEVVREGVIVYDRAAKDEGKKQSGPGEAKK